MYSLSAIQLQYLSARWNHMIFLLQDHETNQSVITSDLVTGWLIKGMYF